MRGFAAVPAYYLVHDFHVCVCVQGAVAASHEIASQMEMGLEGRKDASCCCCTFALISLLLTTCNYIY